MPLKITGFTKRVIGTPNWTPIRVPNPISRAMGNSTKPGLANAPTAVMGNIDRVVPTAR